MSATFLQKSIDRISARIGRGPTLVELTEGRVNNLDVLRLVGALLVIFSHSFPLAGLTEKMPPFYRNHYGTMGVDMFFIISGFLITQSYLRSRNPARFLWSRLLRIFPALVAVVILVAFVAGPLLTTIDPKAYFTDSGTYSFLRSMNLIDAERFATLPGVFAHNPFVQVDGPLWTLQYEWSFYMLVLVLGIAALIQKKGILLALFATSMVAVYLNLGVTSHIYTMTAHNLAVFFIYFAFGSLAYLYRHSIPVNFGIFFFVVFLLVIASLRGGFGDEVFVFLLGYVVLFVGFSPAIRLSWITKYGDFSYGLYLWGWPVQQAVFYLFGRSLNVWAQLGVSLAIAFPLAMLSWHLVEKRLLKLKNLVFPWSPKQKPSESYASVVLSLVLWSFFSIMY